MMCPKKGTNMIGFLPESAASFHLMLLNLSHLRGDRDRGRQWLRARRRCILNTFGRCSPGEGSTAQMLEWNVWFVTRTSGSCSIVQCSLLMEIEFLYSFFPRKKIYSFFPQKRIIPAFVQRHLHLCCMGRWCDHKQHLKTIWSIVFLFLLFSAGKIQQLTSVEINEWCFGNLIFAKNGSAAVLAACRRSERFFKIRIIFGYDAGSGIKTCNIY